MAAKKSENGFLFRNKIASSLRLITKRKKKERKAAAVIKSRDLVTPFHFLPLTDCFLVVLVLISTSITKQEEIMT